ncbi:hypothetical protein Acor_38240 [Acrocarpospora corrugata]|uniref:Uncharacterized protein n=1 Tax=Acrocarpospora corrugata TaxID=35763 RepID=A0A5M3W0N6_9ACTN|nr:hypothetical protein Acor_38240 [Acrocarpospora corrugata]
MVDRSYLAGIVGGVRMGGEVPTRAEHPYAGLPHDREVLPAGDEMHLDAGAVQGGPHIRTDGAGAKNSDLHKQAPFSRRPCIRYTVWKV